MYEIVGHKERMLTRFDRCDRCSAEAKVRAKMNSGDLHLCGHHFKQYEELLRETCLSLYSEMEW